MKKLKKIIPLIIMIILLVGCNSQKFNVNDKTTLTGIITNSEITKDNTTYKISILTLDEPIIINDTEITKIAIDYDKSLKNNTEVTITGTISTNTDTTIDLAYSLSVIDVEDVLSYVNTFSNEDFSVTIPTDLIKICTIEEIENGFTIYSSNTKEEQTEVFKIISVTNEEFNTLKENNTSIIEKVSSNKEKTIIIVYSTSSEAVDENYEAIVSDIETIKETVRIK